MSEKTLKKVIVGSQNPVKIQAVTDALSQVFPNQSFEVKGMHAPSLVSDQPMTAEETRLGAVNRVKYCQEQLQADYYAAIEGGVDELTDGPATFAYTVIADANHQYVGRTACLPLPVGVYRELQAGEELGPLLDKMFNTENIKQKGGAIGLLTNGLATRGSIYREAIILSLAPAMFAPLYFD